MIKVPVRDEDFVEALEAAADIEKDKWLPDEPAVGAAPWLVERRNIFTLYEQNIGPMTPLLADELRDTEKSLNAE